MVILNSMTFASPETRLVLLTWISLFGLDPVTDDRDALASALKVTRSQLKVAITYLVQEGFLFKFRSFSRQHSDNKVTRQYSYVLKTECLHEWHKALSLIRCVDEFLYVLQSPSSQWEIATAKPKPFTASKRLVLAILVSQANRAGYVVGFKELRFSEMLGVSLVKLKQTITALSVDGYVSILSKNFENKAMFGHLRSIYKIHPRCPEYKTLKFGLPPMEGGNLINFFSKLRPFYKRASNQKNQNFSRLQPSPLPSHYYYQLSKVFWSKKLTLFMSHLCQSIIFSVTSDYAAELVLGSQASSDITRMTSTDNLMELVRDKLSDELFNCGERALDINTTDLQALEPGSAEAITFLKSYTLEQLSIELASVISKIFKSLRLFIEIYRVPVQVIGYLPNNQMAVLFKSPEEFAMKAPCKVSIEGRRPNMATNLVLTLLVPNQRYLKECMAFKNELFTVESEVKDERITVVDLLIGKK